MYSLTLLSTYIIARQTSSFSLSEQEYLGELILIENVENLDDIQGCSTELRRAFFSVPLCPSEAWPDCALFQATAALTTPRRTAGMTSS